MEFLNWDDLDFKKRSGNEKLKCPACIDSRTDKRDRSLSISHTHGFGKCHYASCGALVFKDDINKESETKKEYVLPKQDWLNYTELSDPMVKYLESRKIPQSVAIDLGWTQERYYQGTLGKEVDNLVFNFFEGNKIVNKKYRSGGKKFTQSKDGKPILYNINAAIGSDEVWITEGEFDLAALYSIGIKNVVSLPAGANDNDDYWINSKPYLEDVKTFVIAVDMDEAGQKIKESISHRLGKWRCTFIEWRGKDANDDLISGDLEKSVLSKKRFPVNGTLTMADLYDDVVDLYENGLPETYAPKDRSFGNLKNIFSVMRGQLTTVTGIPSHGKSNFTDWYVMNLIKDYGFKASWFSPEHSPVKLHKVSFLEKSTGQNFWGKSKGVKVDRMPKDMIDKYKDWSEGKIYLTVPETDQFPDWDWILNKFKEQMYSLGVDIFVIDAFNKLVMPSGNELSEIRKVLTKLTAFAQSNNVMIFLVAHPTKMKKNDQGIYPIPNLYDVSGSADFRNMTHNGYTIYRHFEDLETGSPGFTEFYNTKTKFSYQGEIGAKEVFNYNLLNGRYFSDREDNRCWIRGEPESKQFPVIDPREAFYEPDKDDLIPF